jgi:hypothetical protein
MKGSRASTLTSSPMPQEEDLVNECTPATRSTRSPPVRNAGPPESPLHSPVPPAVPKEMLSGGERG